METKNTSSSAALSKRTAREATDVVRDVLQLARDKEVDAEKLRVIYELADSARREQARLAYIRAIQNARAKLPLIHRDGEAVIDGKVRYRYARLSTVMPLITPELLGEGLNVSWRYGFTDSRISVTCVLEHTSGYREECTIAAEPDTTGSKNKVQAVVSTVTYLQRITLFALLGIVPVDDEEAALLASSDAQREHQKLLEELAVVADAAGIEHQKLIAYLNVRDWQQITAEQARELIPRLRRRAEKRQKQVNGNEDIQR